MATNRIDILDSALLRPGRIDRKIEFPPPNEEVPELALSLLSPPSPWEPFWGSNPPCPLLQARLDILKIHSRKMNLTRGINLRKIAELMPGASGAEVKVSWGPWGQRGWHGGHWLTSLSLSRPSGRVHRGGDVRAEGEEGARHTGGL